MSCIDDKVIVFRYAVGIVAVGIVAEEILFTPATCTCKIKGAITLPLYENSGFWIS